MTPPEGHLLVRAMARAYTPCLSPVIMSGILYRHTVEIPETSDPRMQPRVWSCPYRKVTERHVHLAQKVVSCL